MEVTRPGTETLTLAKCPCCGGEVDVWDCGYSSFNPGHAKCEGECQRKWKLGNVDSRWDAGEAWNRKAKTLSKRLKAFSLLKVDAKTAISRDYAREDLEDEARRLLSELEAVVIGAKTA